MDQQRQGMICVGLGLGLLGGFAWFETSPRVFTASAEGADAATEFTAAEIFDSGREKPTLRLCYRGWGEAESLAGRKVFSWDVEVFRLPAGADGLIPYVVRIDKNLGSKRKARPRHLAYSADLGDSVTACWIDGRGKIVRSLSPPGAPPPEIDPAVFVVPMPKIAAPGKVRWADGSDGSRWQIEAAPQRGSDRDQIVVDVKSDSVAQRVNQIDCQMRVCYDRRSLVMRTAELVEEGHWQQRKEGSKNQFELVGGSEIDPDRVASMTADLASWETFHDWIRRVARQVSLPPPVSSPPVSSPPSGTALVSNTPPLSASPPTVSSRAAGEGESANALLNELPRRALAVCDSMGDSVLQTGIAAGLFSLRASRMQLLGEQTAVAAMHGNGCVSWNAIDLAGVQRNSAEYHGKPVVMSFLSRGTSQSTQTIRTVAELRRRFPEDQVAVLAFATTYSRENAELISRAIGPTVPVFHDLRIPERMNIFKVGKSTLILLDGDGKPCFVHTWQPIDLVDDICRQLEELCGSPTPASPTPASPTLDSGDFQQITLAAP